LKPGAKQPTEESKHGSKRKEAKKMNWLELLGIVFLILCALFGWFVFAVQLLNWIEKKVTKNEHR